MSGPTSELLILSIPTTKRIEDASTADGQLWASMISAYKSAPETRNVYWGRKIEDPGTVVFIVGTQSRANVYATLKTIRMDCSKMCQ